jgi:hypothetical protein
MDPSSSQVAITDGTKRSSNLDLEKGPVEPSSDLEATTADEAEATAADEKRQVDNHDKDPDIVSWDGANDPENPMNWTNRKKWFNIAVISILTVLT